MGLFSKKPIKWIEVNAFIMESEFSSNTWGTQVDYARDETQRRVKLTLRFSLENGESVTKTRKVFTYTKNRSFFEKGETVAILYDRSKPSNFKLKYDI